MIFISILFSYSLLVILFHFWAEYCSSGDVFGHCAAILATSRQVVW